MGKKSRIRRSAKFAKKFGSKFPLLQRRFKTKTEPVKEPEVIEEETVVEETPPPPEPEPKPKPKRVRKPRKTTPKPRTAKKITKPE